MVITKLFIVLLTILIILQIVKHFKNRYKKDRYLEGATTMNGSIDQQTLKYTDTGLGSDPLYLAKTNAANITYIKSKVDELLQLKQKVNDLDDVVKQNSTGITNISQQMMNSANQLVGRDPNSTEPLPTATGLD